MATNSSSWYTWASSTEGHDKESLDFPSTLLFWLRLGSSWSSRNRLQPALVLCRSEASLGSMVPSAFQLLAPLKTLYTRSDALGCASAQSEYSGGLECASSLAASSLAILKQCLWNLSLGAHGFHAEPPCRRLLLRRMCAGAQSPVTVIFRTCSGPLPCRLGCFQHLPQDS